MLASTRRRVILLDRTIKREAWGSICLVGVDSDAEVKALLSFCRQLHITAVFDGSLAQTPAAKIRQRAALGRLRAYERSYKRLRIVEGHTAEAARSLDGELFDGVVLLGVPASRLPDEGALWAARVAHGGMLIGLGHENVAVRQMLNAAVPKWSAWRYGLWVVPVTRGEDDGAVDELRCGTVGQELGDGQGDLAAPKPNGKDHGAVGQSINPGGVDFEAAAAAPVEPEGEAPGGEAGAQPHGPVIPGGDSVAAKRRGRPPGSRNKVAA
jgi:hypothetical protein